MIAVDGSTYYIASHSNILTVLVVTYHREDFRETTNNFSCFIPFENGTSLQSNEVQVHLNVSCKYNNDAINIHGHCVYVHM